MHLVVVFGPPAVGKMTVGRELCARTGYRLFHNHMTVEPLLGVFDFGTPPFVRLTTEIRQRVIEEAVGSGLPGLVHTMVWGLELEEDRELMQSYVDLVEPGGGRVSFVELVAGLDVRLARNNTELRLAEKRSKRDPEVNDEIVRSSERFVMSTRPGVRTRAEDLLDRHRHLRIDNTELSPGQVVDRVLASWD